MGGENVAARASLGVGSKAMGGDLARLGAGGGASGSGGEASAKDMIVPVFNEDSSGLGEIELDGSQIGRSAEEVRSEVKDGSLCKCRAIGVVGGCGGGGESVVESRWWRVGLGRSVGGE